MKKRIAVLTALVLLLLCFGAFFAFAEEAVPCPDGKHTFGPWTDVPGLEATCTDRGKQVRTCTVPNCGYKEYQVRNALGHLAGTTYVVDVPATCMKQGSQSYHCTREGCNAIIEGTSKPIEKLPHNFGDWTVQTPATCAVKGVEVRKCKNAGCTETESREIPLLSHQIKEEPAISVTCTTDGRTKSSKCIICGKSFEDAVVIKATGHDFVEEPYLEPTCTENGHTAGTKCSKCGLVSEPTTVIPKLGHKTVTDPAVPATCTSAGKTEGSHCERCGKVFFAQADVPMLKHKYAETIVERTCTVDGCHLFTCIYCGDTYQEDIDYALGHKVVVEKAKEETCTTDGLSVRTYCAVCGEILEESQVIPAFGHQWVSKTTPATRKADGKIVTTCSVCGKQQSDQRIAKIATITLSQNKYYYDGTKKTPTIVIKDADGKKLTYKKDYKLNYDSGRKRVGTYYITITFIGNYKGSKTVRFHILLRKTVGVKVTPGKGFAKVTWSKTPGAKSYVVYRCETKNGKYKKVGTTSKTEMNVKNLESGKTYYFIVRAQTVDSAGKTVKAANSPIRKATIK